MNLDFFSVFSYAARYSAFNPIEHLWSPLRNKLAGVVFKSKLDGEDKPPSAQTKLLADVIKEKEKVVFDRALRKLKEDWDDMTFAEHPITVDTVLCGEDDLLYYDYE